MTPSESGDLIITGAAGTSVSTFTGSINDGFTATTINGGAGNGSPAAAYLVSSSGSAINPTWTMSTGTVWASSIAVFTAASATPPSLVGPQIKNFAGAPASAYGGYSGDGGPPTSAQLQFPGE